MAWKKVPRSDAVVLADAYESKGVVQSMMDIKLPDMIDMLLRRGDGPKNVAQVVLNDSMNRFLSAYHQTVMILEVAEKLSREEAEALVQEAVSEKRASWEAECLDQVAVGLLPFLMRLK